MKITEDSIRWLQVVLLSNREERENYILKLSSCGLLRFITNSNLIFLSKLHDNKMYGVSRMNGDIGKGL